jgi:hypothetical protein
MRDLIGCIIFFLLIALISGLIYLDTKGRIKFGYKAFIFSLVVLALIAGILF